jgi:hypothetical protein
MEITFFGGLNSGKPKNPFSTSSWLAVSTPVPDNFQIFDNMDQDLKKHYRLRLQEVLGTRSTSKGDLGRGLAESRLVSKIGHDLFSVRQDLWSALGLQNLSSPLSSLKLWNTFRELFDD